MKLFLLFPTETGKRYPIRTSTDQTKKTDSIKSGRKTFNETEIEVFPDRLRRVSRETQVTTGGKTRTNQLRNRLNQLKEINRKQVDKKVKGGFAGVKGLKKKKESSNESFTNGTYTVKTRKYKNPFSKDTSKVPTNGTIKKKTAKVKDDSKKAKRSQKLKQTSSNIGKRSSLKQQERKKPLKIEK